MSRTPTFERNAVLDAALAQFWEHGFEGTSLAMLETATGLRPGSIYNSFGSKKGLFLGALEHYIATVVDERLTTMLNHPEPLVGIHEFFISSFDSVPLAQLHGCFMTNTATEVCIADADIRKLVKRGVMKMEAGFRKRLNDAKDQELLPANTDLNAKAVHLTSCFQGLEVMARLHRNKKQLRSLSDAALASISA